MLLLGTGGADDTILRALYAGGHPLLVAIARGFTFLGTWKVGIPIVVAGVALLAWTRGKGAAIAGLLVIAVGRILVEVQKYAIHRLRPGDEVHLTTATSPSFPSGHASNSMIVCLTFALLFFAQGRWRGVAIAIAVALSLCIGLSRLLLAVHWPSDVLGGWSFGLLWVLIALPLAKRIARQ